MGMGQERLPEWPSRSRGTRSRSHQAVGTTAYCSEAVSRSGGSSEDFIRHVNLAERPRFAEVVLELVRAFTAAAHFVGIVNAVEVLTPRMATSRTQFGEYAIGASSVTPPTEWPGLAHAATIVRQLRSAAH